MLEPLHPPEQVLEQLEHPLDSEVPVHELEQLDEQYDVQSVQLSFVQLVSMGNALDIARMPITGKAFFAASLKNSLLFCKSLLFMFLVLLFFIYT